MTSGEGLHPRVVILTQSKVNAKSIQYYSQSGDRAAAAGAAAGAAGVKRQPWKKHKNVHSSIIKACALMPDKLQLSFGCSFRPHPDYGCENVLCFACATQILDRTDRHIEQQAAFSWHFEMRIHSAFLLLLLYRGRFNKKRSILFCAAAQQIIVMTFYA